MKQREVQRASFASVNAARRAATGVAGRIFKPMVRHGGRIAIEKVAAGAGLKSAECDFVSGSGRGSDAGHAALHRVRIQGAPRGRGDFGDASA
ncbi:MAG TPA: hypothetical protein PLB22_00980, partial [Ottowia sp.]|nr:hypothetical protein [Ottowia sp.]